MIKPSPPPPATPPSHHTQDVQLEGSDSEWVDVGALQGTSAIDWSQLGYHGTALVLAAGILDADATDRASAVLFIKDHLSTCFPNDPTGPRLANPSCRGSRFYTPYFASLAFPGMVAAGEMDWVLGQYKTCWGWALSQSPTWIEVFDVRWEMVHSWGGCPTWQLSRYFLGLQPREDVGPRHYTLELHIGAALDQTEGKVPCRQGDAISVSWKRNGPTIAYTVDVSGSPIMVDGWGGVAPGVWTRIQGVATCSLSAAESI
mmetsp:Transcript_37487/g.81237  ORF Transcript_37487/g.81237 Transcript_37487/m.81237 type:complete len:259 (+) Transcript_37487:1-777(+)